MSSRRGPDAALADVRRRLNRRIRHGVGLTEEPPARCDDPQLSYLPVDAVARLVHGDLATMIVGGMASLFLQMLHPHAMAGVAQHSRYRNDARGRLLQTANFIGHTTYGTSHRARLDIERVRAVHERVRGVADDGVAYCANDPHLLAWVHACEVSMFLASYRRYGRVPLDDAEADQYVAEMSALARDLGAQDPPTSVAHLWAQIDAFRPELRRSSDAEVAHSFVADGFVRGAAQRVAQRLFVRAAYDLMPAWARRQLGVTAPRRRAVLVRPATRLLCAFVRRVVPPAPRAALTV